MRSRIAVLLLLLTPASLLASQPDHWLQIHTEHFTVITNASDKDARHVAGQFERMRAVFKKLIPTATGGENQPIIVLALKSQKDFDSVEPASALAKNQLKIAGFYEPAQDKNYILVNLAAGYSETAHPYATIYHEYTHLLNRNAEWLPLWLNEGFAEFYQNTDIEEKEVHLGQPSPEDIYYLRDNSLVSLATLFQVDHNSPYYHDEQKGTIFYAESWALTHYLIVTDRTKKTNRLGDYVKNLIHGQDSLTAAQNAFGDLKILQNDLEGYIRQGSFSSFMLPQAFPINEAAFVVEPISADNANAVRADVMDYVGRQTEASNLFETILAADPNNVLALENLGALKFHAGDIAAARALYDKAVAADSHSYLAQYYSAVFDLQEGSADPSPIEARLQTCIQLNPKFAPAYDALAHLYAVHQEKLDEAHMANIHAIELDPANVSYRINAAMVLMQEDQPANALHVLQAAEKIASAGELAIVQGRIRDIERMQAQTAQANTAISSTDGQGTVSLTNTTPTVTTTTETVTTNHGRLVIEQGDTKPHFPTAEATGPHHTVRGIVHNVKCYSGHVLSLRVEPLGKPPVNLYVTNYFKVDFYAMNFELTNELKPCTDIEGMKASIDYAELNDASNPNLTGQILKVELSK
jgi:tetratricopeptide (TPR) repeat protein